VSRRVLTAPASRAPLTGHDEGDSEEEEEEEEEMVMIER